MFICPYCKKEITTEALYKHMIKKGSQPDFTRLVSIVDIMKEMEKSKSLKVFFKKMKKTKIREELLKHEKK